MGSLIKKFFEEYKGARRLSLFWAIWLITIVVFRVTEPEVITKIDAAGASIVSAIIGILATIIGFYQWHRSQDDKPPK